jgi:XTP/dITP diphosphohydrolase
MQETVSAFQRLLEIMAELREKCPWDRAQTQDSIRPLTIEEVHELSEAILSQDDPEIRAELGDLLLHIVFYAHMAGERQAFTMRDIIEGLNAKLIRRHPHVFGETAVTGAPEVQGNWERIKAQEKAAAGKVRASALDGVPASMPSLIMAQRMQEKAASLGFDWPNADEVWAKVEEEMQEFREAATPAEREAEMGDLLFSLVNYCRFAEINADNALSRTNRKFRQRFQHVERRAAEDGRSLPEMTLAEMDVYWLEAKELGL